MGKMGKDFEKLVKIVVRIRKECPWDRQQTLKSLKPYLVEEVYEAMEAIDENNFSKLREEVGDMLLHVVMLSVFASETKAFGLSEVIAGIAQKMVRRHPHVFGKFTAKNKAQVLLKWEKIKKIEAKDKKKEGHSMMTSIPSALPALYRAETVQKRAARVGFDWDKVAGAWEKVHEEIEEVKSEIRHPKAKKRANKLEEEIGDLLFAVTNVARKLNINAEQALQHANNKFIRRFAVIEEQLQHKKLNITQMDRLWDQAKLLEK